MMIFLMVIHVLACLLLIAVILLQAGRGHGLAGGTFGGEMQTVLGTKTASFMSKITTFCAISFIVTCLGIDMLSSWQGRSLLQKQSQNQEMTQKQLEEVLKNLKTEMDKTKSEAPASTEEAISKAAEVAQTAASTAEGVATEVQQTVAAVSEAPASQEASAQAVTTVPAPAEA